MGKRAVLAKLTAAEGRRDELVERMKHLVGETESEPGTLLYVMTLDNRDPDVVWFIEGYTDDDSMYAHGRSEAIKAVGPKIQDVMAGIEIHVLDPVAAKGF